MGQLNKYSIFGLFLFFLAGLALGWFLFQPRNAKNNDIAQAQTDKATLFTCPMHRDIQVNAPGKCPKCSMVLVPVSQLEEQNSLVDTSGVFISNESAELADVQTVVVTRNNPQKEIRLYGKVEADEKLRHNQVATISGRIENLTVYATGEMIHKGQTLALIHSPELVSAQQALLTASQSRKTHPGAFEAAKERLRKWQMSDAQIDAIIKADRVKSTIEVVSNETGIVSARKVDNGEYVARGDILYQISDLSRVWVVFNAYENDLPFLNVGDQILFALKAEPRSNFVGAISYIDSSIDPQTRASKVRVEMANPTGKLKPEMFVSGLLQANVSQYRDKLMIPELAVMWANDRSKVYVKQKDGKDGVFRLREVKLGPMVGNSYVVLSGLTEGEEIVTQGAYNIETVAKRQKSKK